jgi:hypothetical protein
MELSVSYTLSSLSVLNSVIVCHVMVRLQISMGEWLNFKCSVNEWLCEQVSAELVGLCC